MRTILKFIFILLTMIICIAIIVGTGSLFLNKAGIIDINEFILNKPVVNNFAVEKTYQDKVRDKFEEYDSKIAEKDELITQQELTINQLQNNLDSLLKDYKLLEAEVDNLKKSMDSKNELISHYNEMKDKKVAEILDSMKTEDAMIIINKLNPEKIPKVLEYMSTAKVSELTKATMK